VLAELGPTFVKCGQVLSTRPDLVGPAISKELEALQDRVVPLPFEKMRPVLETALHGTVEELFATFDTEPVAAASLSQVYRATLKTGEPVAVKLQRPGIHAVIEADLSLMQGIAEWAVEHVEDLDWVDPAGIVEEFARSIRRELDFTIEARTINRFREVFPEKDDVFIPATYPDLSASQVLTMDWIDGARIDALDEYPKRNCEPKVIAKRGCEIVCEMVFEHRLFHADPHPGNILVTQDNCIAFLDYGMVGHIERTDTAVIADLLQGMFSENPEAYVNAVLMLSTSDEPENRDALERELAEFMAFEGMAIVGGGLVGRGIERAMEILRRHHLELAPRFSLLLKALATIESTAHELDPNIDMIPIIKPYVHRLVMQRYAPWQIAKETHRNIIELLRVGQKVPGEVEQLLRTLRRGRLKIQLNHERLQNLAHILDIASNRVAFGVITGSIIIGSSFLMATDVGARGLGLAGYLIAGVLGLSLAISILRSKRL
ncbi:MAG TPA: AarF/ABC1/UbiB kinase family protein, partial [Candidatus Hydrogenedentes bacterium]|nr:AarF/ABC1/UbiB kinase family protein [Candidatus Hydrogenedentota bacterium]